MAKKRKRIFLVNRDFQLRYTRAAIGVGILSTVLTAVIILYPLYSFEIIRIAGFLPLPIFLAMVLATAMNIIFLGLMGIIITHKIAGPMYSLVRQIRLVGMGKWGEFMRLRDDDEMKYVVRNFNEMIEELQTMNKQDIEAMDQLIEQIEKISDPNSHAAIETANQIKEIFKRRVAPQGS